MKFSFTFTNGLKQRSQAEKELQLVVSGAKSDIKKLRDEFESQVRKAIHGAYAGIVCTVCGQNVFRGEGEWVHGNGGKAYCLEPCWKNKDKEKGDRQ